jgi:hypothetical protein
MRRIQFSLADTLTLGASLIFGYFCYLSLNFYTLGDQTKSIFGSLAIVFILYGLTISLKLLKQTSKNFKKCLIGELILIVAFICLSLFSIKIFSNYFVILSNKESIKNAVLTNLKTVKGIFESYESKSNARLKIYEFNLRSAVKDKDINQNRFKYYGFINDQDESAQINSKILVLKSKLFPEPTYSEMKSNDLLWLSVAEAKLNDWSPFGVVMVITNLEREALLWKKQLKIFYSFQPKGEIKPIWDYNIQLVKNSSVLTKLNEPNLLGFVLGFVLCLIMLFSYFISSRHTRFPGFSSLFSFVTSQDDNVL